MPKLTDQQRTFVNEYVRSGFDRIQACKVAGYSERNPDSIACQLLKKPQVKAEIDRIFQQTEEKVTVEATEIIQGLRKIAFAPPSEKVSNSDRIRAMELLGKTLALYSDSLAISRESAIDTPEIDDDEREMLDQLAREYHKKAAQRGPKLA